MIELGVFFFFLRFSCNLVTWGFSFGWNLYFSLYRKGAIELGFVGSLIFGILCIYIARLKVPFFRLDL